MASRKVNSFHQLGSSQKTVKLGGRSSWIGLLYFAFLFITHQYLSRQKMMATTKIIV